MAARTGERRVAAFLRALAETGNKALAAERARVSKSWVVLRQRRDPAFRAEVDAAVAAAGRRLGEASGVGPDGRWRAQEGEELVVRGCGGRWMQITRAKLNQWTPRVEARFLSALAASCNVVRSCEAVGMSPSSAYLHRQRWPAFAERWDLAIEQGYDRIAMAAVASAGAMLGDAEMVPEAEIGPMTVHDALLVLGLNRRRALGLGHPPGRAPRVKTLAEVTPSIMRKIEIVKRADRAQMAADERAARPRATAAKGRPVER